MSYLYPGKFRRLVFCIFILSLVTTAQPSISNAADKARTDFQSILNESLTALWTGRQISPELSKQIKAGLAAGVVNRTDLESMIETKILSLMDSHKTSRYVIKTAPEAVNALLSPALDWKTFREIAWRAATSPIKASAPLEIKVGTLAPPGTPWLIVPETTVFPEIERLGSGKIRLKIYGGGVMGEDADILRKMDVGQLDGCGCTAVGVLTASPEASALLMPTLFNNYDEVDYIFEKFRQRLDQGFEEKGYILAALIDTGFFYVFTKHKVTGLADIRKQKPYTWFGVVETTFFQELEINAIPMAVPEAVSALSTGLADAATGPAAWFLGMQAYQYVKYIVKPPLFYSPAAIVVSVNTKDRLQKQMGRSETFAFNAQELLVSEFNAIEPEWKRQVRKYEAKCLEAFENKCGMIPITFSAGDMKTIREASQAVQQKLSGKVFPESLINDIQKALADFRAGKR